MTNDELTREANKLQADLLQLIDVALAGSPMALLARPMLRAIVGRQHFLLCSIIKELPR